MVPVNWWTGKAKLNFEKLKGHGKTSEDPLLVESRKCTTMIYHHPCMPVNNICLALLQILLIMQACI